ncbi:CRISPR-associated helicase Cas3' [Streptomyces sp. NPDC020845]|uniref:CRISPR-associated helicase Cas3' n=1 Tax=Streptomyces sp. NPDC020845 TaxID=3365096 RepID=UPI0037BA2428
MHDARPLRAKSARHGETEGELLTTHSLTTLRRAGTITARIGRIPGLPPRFPLWLRAASFLHDTGKAAEGLQRQIGNTDDPPKIWGERHEILSLGFLPTVLAALEEEEILWIATGVVTHHLPLTGEKGRRHALLPIYNRDTADDFAKKFGPLDADTVQNLTDWLHTTAVNTGLIPAGPCPTLTPETLVKDAHTLFGELLDQWEWPLPGPDAEIDGITAVLLQGGVTMADRMASAHTPVHQNHPLTPAYRNRLENRLTAQGHRLRPHQAQAAHTSGHVFIRAWTGSGKTEAALLWALRNLHEMTAAGQGTPRIFYLLPYLAAINAMVRRLEDDLHAQGEIGVSHSHAASYYLSRAQEDECPTDTQALAAARKSLAQENATRLFRELIRVGTPYQPLRGTLAGPAHSSVLLDTANSLFILDELHAYDPRRLGMILAMMRFWERLGGRFAIVSATLPDALQEAIRTALTHQAHLIEPPQGTAFPRRHRLSTRPHTLRSPEAIAEMTSRLQAGEALLVVANNRPTARALYRELGPIARRIHRDPDAAIMLHSRYRRDHRADIEDRIRRRYKNGHKARKGGLLVATQTVEVSLDVDFDSIHTACAPMDALCQRFGRVNRSGARPPADVIVHAPQYMPRRGEPGFFTDGVYPKQPVALAWNILQRHDGNVIDEAMITTWLNEIYANTDGSWGASWRTELEHFKERFTEAFLTWTEPFRDRSELKDDFDAMFDGKEAILTTDRDEYARRLATDNGRRPGRLLAEDLLIPIAGNTETTWDDKLKVHTINAEYDKENGLGTVRR